MTEAEAIDILHKSKRVVFSTRDFSMLAQTSIGNASQMLKRMTARGRMTRLYRGLWAESRNPFFNRFEVVPFLTKPHPGAVSLLTALHLHGMIEQIPQVIDVVTTQKTKKIKTPLGVYSLHQIDPLFFCGYEYYKDKNFLMATPEKALVDCFYFSVKKGKNFSHFPEISWPKEFSWKKVKEFIKKIPDIRTQKVLNQKLLQYK